MQIVLIFIAITIAFPVFAKSRGAICNGIHTSNGRSHTRDEHQRLVSVALLSYRNQEVALYESTNQMGRMNVEVEKMNKKTVSDLLSLPIDRYVDNRMVTVDKALAQKIVESINLHPVVSNYQYNKYNQKPGVQIGFCFGRATYAHLMALHLGVQKDSIKKIWAVGPMKAGGLLWDFHVATVVRSQDEWLVIDGNDYSVISVSDWYKKYSAMSSDGKLRIYITDANKFSVDLGKYDSLQMGLNLTREQDWYSGYFKDLMAWFSHNGGLPDLRPLRLAESYTSRVQKGVPDLE